MIPARLAAGLTALALLIVGAAAGSVVVHQSARDTVLALAPLLFADKARGLALQRAAIADPELLPLYGSSELTLPSRWHASALLRERPTGFTVFPVGDVGSAALLWTQALAGLGTDLQGRKIAISLPSRSLLSPAIDAHAYAANFSRLHANTLAFSPRLDFAVKQAAARRLLQYPATLEGDPLLRFALTQLANGSAASRSLYYASLPLGLLCTAVLELRDQAEASNLLRSIGRTQPHSPRPAAVDYDALARRAESEDRADGTGNSFGFARAFWDDHAWDVTRQKGMYGDGAALRALALSAEWTDVELLLRVVRQLGGEPLLLATPFNARYADHIGVDAEARQAQQQRLHAVAAAHGAALVDFTRDGTSELFTINPAQHLSGTGWVAYGKALDDFFHGRLSTNPPEGT